MDNRCLVVGELCSVDQPLTTGYELDPEERLERDPAKPIRLGSGLDVSLARSIFVLPVPTIFLTASKLRDGAGEVAVHVETIGTELLPHGETLSPVGRLALEQVSNHRAQQGARYG